MKITITRSEIKSIVTGFSKIISAKPSLTVLGYIRLDRRGGKLIAQATDLDQTATYCFENAELEGDIGAPVVGSVLIPFQLLKDLAKGSPTETISLATVDGKTVSVTSHVGSHSVTRTVDCFELDAWPDAGEDIPTTEANGFMASFRRVAQFTSVDSTREVLTGVLVDVGGQGDHNATLVATDGRRMTCCNSLKLVGNVRDGRDGKDKKDDNDVIVPVTKFLTWTALPDEATLGVARDNLTTRICVKAGPWGYVTKGINGRYPNWRQVLPTQENMAHEVRFTDSEVGALRQILPTLPGKDAIVLEGKAGRLNLCAADDTGKTLTVPLTAGSTYTGSGCRLILDRRYLLDALNAGFRNFLFAGTEMPIRSQDDKGGIHVLMPLREDPIKTPSQAQSEASVNDPVAESTSATSAAPVKPATPVTSVTPMTSVTPVTSVTSIPPVSPSIVQPTAQSTPPPQEKQDMNNQNSQATQATPVSALEALQASFDSAKAKLRDAQFALVEVGASLRDALKEERQRRSEAESVRSTLRKLQSIRV